MTGRHHSQRIPADQLEDAPDDELLRLWLDGHREALDELVDRHRPWMVRLVRALSKGERDAEAVVQDAWLDVMRAAGTFRGDGSVHAWLGTIVRRRIASTWRARAARPDIPVEFVPEDAARDEFEERLALRDQLRGLLAALPTDQREAVWLVDVVGFSVDEAAALLEVPAGTVKSRCHRGRARLRLVIRGRD
jgi:RNA polymerase sigma-70 factor (ECF subfamily)